MTEIKIESNVLSANESTSKVIQELLQKKGVFAVNILSSPGSGKTTILEKTLERLNNKLKCAVIEGDVQTELDLERLAPKGFPVILINTGLSGGGCHLEAEQVKNAVNSLILDFLDLLFIENVGNLVCPAEFELGENCKITVISVTEGEDKPLKYPVAFRLSELVLINKIDLVPHLSFDTNLLRKNIGQINPRATIIELSARTEEGLDEWINWLIEKAGQTRESKKT